MKLPQCEIFFKNYQPANLPTTNYLLINGGRAPNEKFFRQIAQGKKIIAVDKGIEICRATNILPEMLIGDFDSAEKISIDWAEENKIKILRHPVDKDFTDLQLALDFVENSALITGCFGGRVDHLFSTIFTCANSDKRLFLADEREIIFFLKSNETAEVNFFEKPFAISTLPITETCEGVILNNVHWQLENSKLQQKIPNAISNRLEGDKIKISLNAGFLAIYFVF